jgi:hypothetical protein
MKNIVTGWKLDCYRRNNFHAVEIDISRVKEPYFGWRGFSGSMGSTATVVTTGLYTSYPTHFSALADWTLKQQCSFTVSVCISANSDVIISLRELRFQNNTLSSNLHIVYMSLIMCIITCMSCVSIASKSFNSPLCCHVLLGVSCLISNA